MNDQMLIKILRWLMKPKIWRFVGFASAVVGLLCYALSSSFKHLFGEWTFLKIFLYSVFSLIISLMILYAKIWRHSRSLRFKVHMGFLVLAITSIYSSFSDRVMNGKPDVYSLISSAAFAIMSLSLSRQVQCGFEVDFLYFFLGCLIVQLMKIKLQLAIVGVSFSYCLVILRSSFPSIENEDTGSQDEHHVVIEVDSLQLRSTNIAGMMQQLETCVKALQQENSNVMKMLSERAKECLEGKFEAELVTDDNYLLDALPSGRMNELYGIVKLMMDAACWL
ncbi:uncharacterized protein LOC130733887 [Lotus japonicus]|uniref:uncharacterized protein LOC130733887 n=1 Tax=Lotus japonicus TaxID=34305 RepID=UPI002586421D|nr:uncharacterized protein LOC130733887 [Lotus japonicus]XP_057442154.1 uncharacterized protein LOC130733887 [Lotus japonicus]